MRKCLGFGVNNNFLCKLFRETKVIKTKTQEVCTFYNWIIIHQTSSVFVNTYLRSTEEGGLDRVGEGAVAGRGGCSRSILKQTYLLQQIFVHLAGGEQFSSNNCDKLTSVLHLATFNRLSGCCGWHTSRN